jgi:pimeloyl-ACP methyl ester carboxylesterase
MNGMKNGKTPLIERRHIRVGDSWVHYRTAGSGSPLVLVHGLASSTRWWRRNMAALAAHFRVYAVDLSEFGDRRLLPRFGLRQAAHYLAWWMDAVNLAQADLLGHSMGGRIVAEFAAEYPARVARLVLVNAAILPFGHGYIKQSWGLVRAFQRISPSLFPVLLYDTLHTGVLPVLLTGRELMKTNLEHKLGQIQAPTLIVWGEDDTIVPLALGQRLHQQLVHSRFVVIRGAVHVPMWEKSAEFNRIVLEFLTDQPNIPLRQLDSTRTDSEL